MLSLLWLRTVVESVVSPITNEKTGSGKKYALRQSTSLAAGEAAPNRYKSS
ncbi:hypothetical protein OROHE_000933 [Orobanche hederae]